ncbi:MAG: MXAN_5187 C-terminal domain-containing protein [Archangium sp.]
MPSRALRDREEERNPIKDSEEANARCVELDAELAELRAAYELYFQGIERFPPTKKHEAFKKAYAKLKGTFVRQTAAKFRIDGIGQKLMTFERLWERTLKEIENGTYKRELMRARRHRHDDKPKQQDADFDVDEDLDLSDLDEGDGDLAAALKAAEAAVPAAKPAPAPLASPPIPAVKPATGLTPAIAPVTPSKGVVPGVAPLTPFGAKPATGIQAAFNPLAAPAVAPGAKPTITSALSGSNPALKPGTGVAPAIKPATGVQAALKPAGATGSNPALKPPGATGSNPALKPSGGLPPRPAGGDGGLSDTKIKAIYDAYVMAKKRCGEDTRAVTYDSVATSLKKQVPELMKQHNAKSVEFKVVIKDGKAVLRALPKEE